MDDLCFGKGIDYFGASRAIKDEHITMKEFMRCMCAQLHHNRTWCFKILWDAKIRKCPLKKNCTKCLFAIFVLCLNMEFYVLIYNTN